MNDLLERLTSRKFLLTIAGLGITAYYNQWPAFTAILLAYLTAEGGADIVQRIQKGTSSPPRIINPMSHNELDDDDVIDRTTIVTGKDKGIPLFDEKEKE